MKRPLALAVLCACGARTPLEVTTTDGGVVTTASCPNAAPQPRPCIAWGPAGDPISLFTPPDTTTTAQVTSLVGAGCGAMVAWYTASGVRAESIAWTTRTIGFDGLLGAPNAHPALATTAAGGGVMELASNGDRFAGLLADSTGCRFVPLDAAGADAGAAVTKSATGCFGLAAQSDGFSFLLPSARGATPVALEMVDALGAPRSSATLTVPSGRAAWNRHVLGDGSFLMNTFSEDPMTTVYTDWLQHFDARGTAIAKEVVVGANTAPVHAVPTALGVLAAWEWSTIHVVLLDRNGTPMGREQTYAGASPLYGMTLAPTPNGDVLLAWSDLAPNSHFQLHLLALGPDGAARGRVETFQTPSTDRVFVVVAPDGVRALLVYADDGVKVQRLACAT